MFPSKFLQAKDFFNRGNKKWLSNLWRTQLGTTSKLPICISMFKDFIAAGSIYCTRVRRNKSFIRITTAGYQRLIAFNGRSPYYYHELNLLKKYFTSKEADLTVLREKDTVHGKGKLREKGQIGFSPG